MTSLNGGTKKVNAFLKNDSAGKKNVFEATNCYSIITLKIIRENKSIDQFPTPKHQKIWLPFCKLLAFNVIITAR